MKRKTLNVYSKTIFSLLLVASITAVFSLFSFLLESRQSTETSDVVKENYTVIIDPGHGGEDGGAVGLNGTLEKNINLKISSILFDLFSLVDIDTVITRETDVMLYEEGQSNRKKFYDLKNRVEIAEKYDNPIFLSIHQNKFPISKYKGLQVYYSKNNPDSRNVALRIQSNTVGFLQPENNRLIKEAGKNIFLLEKLNCPAVLIECGFLSNPDDEYNLSNIDYQRKLAFTIFSSVIEFLADDLNKL